MKLMALDITSNTNKFFVGWYIYKTTTPPPPAPPNYQWLEYKIKFMHDMVLSIISFDATWKFTSSQLHKEQ